MAKAHPHLITALRRTADRLERGAPYQWGHMGSCNCGHLVQELTRLSKAEIHQRALQSRSGDWNEQLIDYCPTSGLPLDEVISELLAAGLDIDDLRQLERLSNPLILQRLPQQQRNLLHNRRQDVVAYLQAWAGLLEDEWLRHTPVPTLKPAQASPHKVVTALP
ncbi:hypothetical protein [Cesiribacter andamanensis]|uniref:Uncharacterized protein n=1 Tax=Cesiribacter andamanensis AMV16 TaxID=1279009 RepID=M7N361_9BACT|nr:hypothetical protein [Cesiribacter andamanensis]EMR01661.1 hypothetical protein ADICEAN_03208 [Cesiribacter andamanensis AMV16]